MTTNEFISKATSAHGGKYDYSEVQIINSNVKVKINCTDHGVFIQRPASHLHGDGCPKCGGQARLATVRQLRMLGQSTAGARFVHRASEIHKNRYDYSQVSYVNMHTKVKIVCPFHGAFNQSPGKHIDNTSPTGCPMCGGRPIITTAVFTQRAVIVHGDRYDYSRVFYKSYMSKVDIICKIHGLFKQAPDNHVSKKQGCPSCKREAAARRGVGGYNETTIKSDDSGVLYFALLTNESEQYYKIGITKNNPTHRLKNHGCDISVIREIRGSLIDMYRHEQDILHRMKDYRYKYKPLTTQARRAGWTECFQYSSGNILAKVFDQVTGAI